MKTTAIAGIAAALLACSVPDSDFDTGSAGTAMAASTVAAPAQSGQSVTGQQAFETECGACHMAYPPALLPARSWQAITSNLSDHFGEDASLDPDTTKKIADYLVANAGDTTGQGQRLLRGEPANQVPARITETRWWRQIHSEIPDAYFKRPNVMTKSNCLACHGSGGSGEGADNDD